MIRTLISTARKPLRLVDFDRDLVGMAGQAQIDAVSETIGAAAIEISSGSNDLSERTEQQASSLRWRQLRLRLRSRRALWP